MKRTHIDLFADNSWGWTLVDATISGGTLNITGAGGYGQRSPDAGWYSGVGDNFIIEADFKLDVINTNASIRVYLIGDAKYISFYTAGSVNEMRIYYDGLVKASQVWVEDTNWHTMKIRKAGAIYYMSIDGGAEISWNYGTARALEYIQVGAGSHVDVKFDNFKYSYIELGVSTGVGNPLIL